MSVKKVLQKTFNNIENDFLNGIDAGKRLMIPDRTLLCLYLPYPPKKTAILPDQISHESLPDYFDHHPECVIIFKYRNISGKEGGSDGCRFYADTIFKKNKDAYTPLPGSAHVGYLTSINEAKSKSFIYNGTMLSIVEERGIIVIEDKIFDIVEYKKTIADYITFLNSKESK